jgi:hypothetical protein
MTLAPRRPTHTFGGEGQENLPLQAGSEHARVQQRVTARSGELVPGQRRDHDPRADLLLLPQPRFSNDARRLTRSTGYSRCSTRQATTSTSRAPCGRCAGCPTLSEFWAIGRSVSRQSPDPVGAADGTPSSGQFRTHQLDFGVQKWRLDLPLSAGSNTEQRVGRVCRHHRTVLRLPTRKDGTNRRSKPPDRLNGHRSGYAPAERSGRWYRPDHPQWIDPLRRCVVESSERQQDDTSRPSRGIGWEMLGMIPQILKRAVALQLWHTAARGIRART